MKLLSNISDNLLNIMSKLYPVKISTDYGFIERAGQIGPKVPIKSFITNFAHFLSSPAGIAFTKQSIRALTGKEIPIIASIKAKVFQQGFFQFVVRVNARDRQKNKNMFCLILSKGNELSDAVSITEFNLLQKYHSRHPDLFVEPLVLHLSQPVLYSSRLYEDELEIDYNPDKVEGRNGLFFNSAKISLDKRPFSLKEQDPLLEEMIKILAVAYDEKSGEAILGPKISAGDFILNYKSMDDFHMRLISVRATDTMDIPTFVCSLLNNSLGLKLDANPDKKMTHLGFIFDETTVYNGLVKAFQYKQNLSDEEANRKAAYWMSEYHRAKERGALNGYLDFLKEARTGMGLESLPRFYHKRGDSNS